MKRSMLALAAYFLLTLIATHPLWQRMSDSVPGDIGDPLLNTYILAWDAHALVSDPLNLFNANIFYPLPNTLAYSENLIGDALIALPIALITGQPLWTYNFTFLLSFVLAGFGMYLFVLRLTRQRAAAFVAGVAFAFVPYRIASLAHIQLLTTQWLPLLAYGLWRIADRSSTPAKCAGQVARRDGRSRQLRITNYVLLFTFLWLQIASTLHGALFAALIIFVFLVINFSRIMHYFSRFTLISFISLISLISLFTIALLPLVVPYLAVVNELRAARPPDVAASFLAQPSDFLAAYPWNRLFGDATDMFRQRDGFTDEQTLFMGIVAPLLALVGVWTSRRERSWDLGVGSWKLVFGGLLVGALLLATSPLLVQAFPLASVMRVPARWGIALTFALAGLCGMGSAKLLTAESAKSAAKKQKTPLRSLRSLWFVFPVLVVAVFAEGFAAPILLAKVGAPQAQSAVYQYLAQLPGHEAIIELPLYVAPDAEFPEAKRMVASALHWRPLVNGYSGFTPARQLQLAAQLKNFPDDASLATLRGLARQGVRYVVAHSGEPGLPRRAWVQTNRALALASGALRFVQSFNDDDLFEIVP